MARPTKDLQHRKPLLYKSKGGMKHFRYLAEVFSICQRRTGDLRMLIHTVFFWLKDSAPLGERQRLVEGCMALLGKIPAVRHIWAGPPANTPKREVIDDTYDV